MKDCDWSMPMNGFRKYFEVHLWNSSNALVAHGSSAQLTFIAISASCFSGPHSSLQYFVHQAHDVPVDRSAEGEGRNSRCRELVGVGDELVVGFRLGRYAGLLEKRLVVVDRLAAERCRVRRTGRPDIASRTLAPRARNSSSHLYSA